MTNIEKLIERMGWQPIEVKPENDGDYLVFMPSRNLDKYSVQNWKKQEFSFSNDYGITHWRHIPTGKEGEIVRVLLEALKYYDNLHSGDNTALEALAKAEELAGEV